MAAGWLFPFRSRDRVSGSRWAVSSRPARGNWSTVLMAASSRLGARTLLPGSLVESGGETDEFGPPAAAERSLLQRPRRQEQEAQLRQFHVVQLRASLGLLKRLYLRPEILGRVVTTPCDVAVVPAEQFHDPAQHRGQVSFSVHFLDDAWYRHYGQMAA